MFRTRFSLKIFRFFIVPVSFALISNACVLIHKPPRHSHLHECAIAGDTACVLKELAMASPKLNLKGDAEMTPLHYSCMNCRIDVVKLLLELGADVNKKAKGGATALHFAAQEGCIDALILLLENGADISARDREGRTPLDRAIQWEQKNTIEYLKKFTGK